MKFGVSYYPEQKEEREVAHDIALMKESGINIVRLGEFAWCKFEPAEGRYDFSWLDVVIEELGKAGIGSIVCTPTACPPAWLIKKNPAVLYKDNRGVVRPFGGRRHYCYNNPDYREYSRRIAGEIGRHYGGNPYVVAFQIDNELAQEGTGRCHCSCCLDKFHGWLEDRYSTVENLNRKLGTIFWGQTYDRIEQINMPVNTIETGAQDEIRAFYENPSLRLEYERFCSDSNIEYQDIQRDELKKHTDKPVTTNATGLATNSINYYEAFENLDVYAYDFYPDLRGLEINSFSYAFARGIKNKSFWLLEFTSGGGHRLGGAGRLQPYPGAMKQAVVHAFASGAELLAHFQFRTFPYGAEQINYAIVDIDGIPRRRFYEMKDTALYLKQLEEVLSTSTIENQAAVCFDYNTLWALKIKPVNNGSFDYLSYCNKFYNSLMRMGIGVDVVSYGHGLDRYKMVILPAPFVMSEEHKMKFKEYVKNGGILLSTFLTAVKNEYNTGLCESLPCGLTDLFGIRVAEVEPVFEETMEDISLKLGAEMISGKNRYWTEVLEPDGAELIGVYDGGFRKGTGVVSRNTYGKGQAFYIGTGTDEGTTARLLEYIAGEGRVERVPFAFEEGIEVIERRHDGKPVYCIFNFLKAEVFIKLDGAYTDLPTGRTVEGRAAIPPKGCLILAGTKIYNARI